ncbi:MAG: YigZ family protein, partial [Flavobacteriales bacterium]|nr:YigZ family protein [Flavobacteriales bacterium]
MTDGYRTIAEPSEGLYKEKGSKFLAFAYPVFNEEEFKEKLTELKKQYHDARHHCYAFKFGLTDNEYRYSDDGEPNNSAGAPIFGQIQSFELTNIAIIVVRYFGGTKL